MHKKEKVNILSSKTKIVVINRGIPSLGKSRMAFAIKALLSRNKYQVAIHSTDSYFIHNGRYTFDNKKAGQYHQKNKRAFLEDLKRGIDVVICDNTNLSPSHSFYYTQAAREYGYFILLLSFHPRDIGFHISESSPKKTSALSHRVPENVIKQMMEEYMKCNLLLKNEQSKQINISSDFFDADVTIEIYPEKYEEQKNQITFQILKLFENESS